MGFFPSPPFLFPHFPPRCGSGQGSAAPVWLSGGIQVDWLPGYAVQLFPTLMALN